MQAKTNKIKRFWAELKRRKVFRSLAIYAGTAFIILEASTIVFPRWGLPDWSIDLVLYLLIFGAFVNLIIAWIYDITPEGLQRTLPVEETTRKERTADSRGWKAATYVSLVVIVCLILFNALGGTKQLRAGDIQSLVILPFENYTGDDALENMVAGMHSLLIGDMSRVSGLRVIGKTSSKLYGESDMSAADIAGELNVDAVVEATVMCLGDSVCMQFRLVSTRGEEEQLWVGEYSEDKGQILNLYNRVTKQIAQEVHIELTANEELSLAKDRRADRDALDEYILSSAYWGDLSAEAFDKAEEYLLQALKKDPQWAPIYAALAIVWAGRMQMGIIDVETGRLKINENIKHARELDPEFSDSHFINGVIYSWPDWDWEKGEKELLRALAKTPNHVLARMYYAHLLMILQRLDEALDQAKLALDLDPKNPLILSLYSVILKGDNQHSAVLDYVEQALSLDPEHSFSKGQLGRAIYNNGEFERHLERQAASLSQRLGENQVPDLLSIYREQGHLAAYRELAHLWEIYYAGSDQSAIGMARHYYRAAQYEKALDKLEIGYRQHNPNMPYIGTGTRYKNLHDSVRFLAILDSMNLPHPKSH